MSDDMGAILLIVFASLGGLCGLLALMAVLEPAKPRSSAATGEPQPKPRALP